MAKKTISYDIAKSYVKDKDVAINTFIEQSLNKTQQIFHYENLPDTIPQSELEYILQTKGHCIIAEVDDRLYALAGGFSGEEDVYGNPTQYTVSNVALNHFKTYNIGEDCVLIKNDYNYIGLLPIIQKYGVLMLDTELSLNTAAVLSRITMLISAPDDKTKASADLFIKRILDGDYTVIGENGFFDGIKLQTPNVSGSNYINQLIELMQYYKATFLNEIGLQANYNMKRERLIESEVAMNVDNLLPFIDNMFSERVHAFTKVNEMYGTEIVVDYNSAWKTTHEHADKELALTDESEVCENVETEESTTVHGDTEIETETAPDSESSNDVPQEENEMTDTEEEDTAGDEMEEDEEERGKDNAAN